MTQSTRKSPLLTLSRFLRKNQTPAEAKLWMHLRGHRFNGFKFKRQVAIGPYIVDFSCFANRLVIEIDGGQHSEQEDMDAVRTDFLVGQGYRVIRFWNRQVIGEIDSVLDEICAALEGISSN